MKADIGVIGLAVMGQNLILNMSDHGYRVLAHNRSTEKIDAFLGGPAAGKSIEGAYSLDALVAGLTKPRKIMLMVKAGEVVDQFIDQLLPLLEAGDILIDGGNSNFPDTSRRVARLRESGIHFVGTGVSGGEEGARFGPSLMPGGSPEAWPVIQPIFQAIAAKTNTGEPCCDWVGEGGAGHFVKMVHNGIEYGDMQLICEAYHFMKDGLGMRYPEMQATFAEWNRTELESYLIEITADILSKQDDFPGQEGTPLLENILDKAGQKGTGKWTGINALTLGVPLTLITESVFARCLSALKDQRVRAEALFEKSIAPVTGEREPWLQALRQALLAAKIISYTQGFMLMRQASEEYQWRLDYGNVAAMWRGGCIIRSVFLNNIQSAYRNEPELDFLGADPYFRAILQDCLSAWRKVAAKSLEIGLPMPCITSALTFLDGYTSATLPANLIQAQRDYFGAHTYARVDRPESDVFHTNWTGSGGDVASSNYKV